MVRDLNTPFGGIKDSGIGREGGVHSLEYFSEAKNIYIHLPRPVPPGDAKVSEAPKKLLPVVASKSSLPPAPISTNSSSVIDVSKAPKPVGAYPHARIHGDLLFLSGIGSRTPGTNAIPGGPTHEIINGKKNPLDYDIKAQTHQVIENIKTILDGSGASFEDIIDVQVFLIDMDRDFAGFNAVYGEYFKNIQATRTTIAIRALPTPIAVEFKVIATARNIKSK
jgi:2-aminomuconate deaminase